MKYSVVSAGRFYDCGEESTVYFDPRTGDTHLISDFAAHIIRLLTEGAMDSNALRDKLLPHVDADNIENLATVIPNILTELISLEIAEQQ